jgi:hypothetical protein
MNAHPVAVADPFDLRQVIAHPRREQHLARLQLLAGLEPHVKRLARGGHVGDRDLPELDAVLTQFPPADLEQFERRRAVAREIPMELASGGVSRLARVAHEHAAAASAEEERGTETCGSAADDDHVQHARRGAKGWPRLCRTRTPVPGRTITDP